jgi:hypothetical protein
VARSRSLICTGQVVPRDTDGDATWATTRLRGRPGAPLKRHAIRGHAGSVWREVVRSREAIGAGCAVTGVATRQS